MPVVLKRWSVPTGEPDNTERVPSGSVGGWGKRSVSYLARSLPNLVPRVRLRQRLTPGVDMTSDVKSREQLFYVCLMFFLLDLSEEPEPVRDDG